MIPPESVYDLGDPAYTPLSYRKDIPMSRIQIRRYVEGDTLHETKILAQPPDWESAIARVPQLAPAVVGELHIDGTFEPVYIRIRKEP